MLLTATTTGGVPLEAFTVDWRLDGGAFTRTACPGPAACAIGQEQAGRFELNVSKPGYAPALAAVTVTADVCHVQTQSLTVMLQAAP